MALEEAKDDLLRRAAEVCAHTPGGRDSVAGALGLLRLYYRHVAAEDLLDRDPVNVYGPAMSHRHLGELRPQGRANVRVYTPTLDEHGWDPGHSVVQVVTDDMPFLVDSVTMELNRHDIGIHLIVHPQLRVRRDVTGKLLEFCATKEAESDPAVLSEAWMYLEIDRQTDPAGLKQLEDDLQRVLHDVRSAIEDSAKMTALATQIADVIAADPPPLDPADVADSVELLRWLADGHFVFLGYREYALETTTEGDMLRALPGTGLGILRADKPGSESFAALPPEVRAKAREKQLLIVTKANSRATVHRPRYLDYVGVKKFDQEGEVVGERRFLGLFTHVAYSESISRIPVLKRKLAEVIDRAGLTPDSHDGKDIVEILETYPRSELFRVSVDELLPIAMGVLRLRERKQLKLFLRADDYGRFMSCLVYLPRDRYNTTVRMRMQEILLRAFQGSSVDFSAMLSESALARVHFVVRGEPGRSLPEVDAGDLETQLTAATRSWEDDLAEATSELCGEESAPELLRRYGNAFPGAYKEDFPPRTAVADIRRLEELPAGGEAPGMPPEAEAEAIGINLYEPYDAAAGERRLKIYKLGAPISLTAVLPLLERMGVEVIDERPYRIHRADGVQAWVYDFGLRYAPSDEVERDNVKELFQDAFLAFWRQVVESDGFNALVLRAGLTWRQAEILRVYAKYLRQAGATFSQNYIEQVLVSNIGIAKMLIRLFEWRFDPARREGAAGPATAQQNAAELAADIEAALDGVASLDEDRILRAYLSMIQATLRTNWFQRTADGRAKPYVSLKLDPEAIPVLPMPRPKFEIFVYSPRVEGVHLRFGKVARGGLRWSDRREDFRTEILGLVKAQTVKNTVIVPTGAKGGFVCKRLPDPGVDREAYLAEGIDCYKTFIAGLLDITDNLEVGPQGTTVLPPPDVVRHDGDDSYLVVAADKGTATFSDIANEVAAEYRYWLGDAFASGGSVGYDHKAMAITARGAWESVKYHFRRLGVDVQHDDITVVGIGDMSGDVFGNGMLLSEHIKLIAAFDHRHVFVDPDPDPAASWQERRRLFELSRSSWADYDASLISAGGGVWPRTAKAVEVSPQMRSALGLDEEVAKLTPADLIKAVLKAPVHLLWNGGIGTYVKASTETHVDVGDRANDGLRVDASELRCKVIGEGGNLGLTQRARIEFALRGGLVNTDFIDNSAGVDLSDHEVNIKILLDRVVRDGELTVKQRNQLFLDMTDEVAELVLRDNYAQNVALAAASAQASSMLHVHARYLRKLERDGLVKRSLEGLPEDKALVERRQAGLGLTAPEFAVLLAFAKIQLDAQVLASDLPDDPYLASWLVSYFPTPLRERFREYMDSHPLRREIITTQVINDLVNTSGTTFTFRLTEETGASAPDIARAYLAARDVFDLPSLWQAVEALDNGVDVATRIGLLLEGRKLTERGARWLLMNRRPPLDLASTVKFFAEPAAGLLQQLPKLLVGRDLASYEERRDSSVARGVPLQLAERVAALVPAYSTFDVVEIAASTDRSVQEVAEVYFDLADRLQLTLLRERIIALPRDTRWNTMARSGLRDDLYAAHAALTRGVLVSSDAQNSPEERLAAWSKANASAVARAGQTLSEIWESDTFDLATLSVALRAIRTLVSVATLPHGD